MNKRKKPKQQEPVIVGSIVGSNKRAKISSFKNFETYLMYLHLIRLLLKVYIILNFELTFKRYVCFLINYYLFYFFTLSVNTNIKKNIKPKFKA